MTPNEYRMLRDYGNGINEEDIVMVVLKEDPEYCIKLYDSMQHQDVVVSKCKIDNAEGHFAFEQGEKGLQGAKGEKGDTGKQGPQGPQVRWSV